MKFTAIRELNEEKSYSISYLCDKLEVSRAAYYKWINRKPSNRQIANEQLAEQIIDMYNDSNGVYGSKMMKIHINRRYETNHSHKKIRRIMRALGLYSVIRRKSNSCTIRSPKEQAAENILNRDFSASKINQKWLTDVTEFKYGMDEKAYLSAILDLCDRRIVSFVLSHKNNNELVFETFDIAIAENPGATPLFHSDRGFQYTSPAFKNKLQQAHMIQSMSRVGKCIDNGPMEGFWGILKTEMYYLNKFNTYEELKEAIEKYIYYYNNNRYQEKLDCLSPMEYHKKMAA